jgi:hypothetical protein
MPKPAMVQKASVVEQALPSMQVQVPDAQVPQEDDEMVQVLGNPPEAPRPPLLPKMPPLLPKIPPLLPLLVLHWHVLVLQVVPVAQLPPQFAGQTQLLPEPQVAGGPQGGLQLAVTQAPFSQTRLPEQPFGPQPPAPPSTAVHAPLVVLQL